MNWRVIFSLSDCLIILNQLPTLNFQDKNLTEALDTYKQKHIISSETGKISSTRFNESGLDIHLITVGLGNLKELTRISAMKIFGSLLQTLKDHITEADVLFQSFASKVIEKNEMAELFSLQAKKALYHFNNYKTDKKNSLSFEFENSWS